MLKRRTDTEDDVALELVPGCPPVLNDLAEAAAPAHSFLRAAWFEGARAEQTLVATRADGTPIAALPTVAAGPKQLGMRALAGGYWPFRTLPVSQDATDGELGQLLVGARRRNLLGPIWRLGPVYACDEAAGRLRELAEAAGWTVLTRSQGRTFIADVARKAEAGEWPAASTRRRLARYEKRLAEQGAVAVQRITGADWSPTLFDELADVEARSWIAAQTDNQGAKFNNPRNRRVWEAALADPVLAAMLRVVVVRLDGRAVAFSLDLAAGATVYGIAGTFDQEQRRFNVGKISNLHSLIWSVEAGARHLDWGAGDGGYKRELGLAAGPEIVDLLFVRDRLVAPLLRARWEGAAASEGDEARSLPFGRRELLVAGSLVTAAAVGAMAE